MTQESPFSHLFQLFGRTPQKHVESINKAAFDTMAAWLESPVARDGRCILLRAPRAGYGKSHLLSRLQNHLGASHEFILLQPTDGYRVDATSALNDVLAKITRTLPGSAGLTTLDLLARKVFSLGLEPLVRSGEVPCQDRDAALHALQNRPTETFDFHHPTAVTAHWARDHFEILGPRLVVEIAQVLSAPLREVGFWVDVMFRYSVTPVEQPGRAGMLMAAVADAAAASMNDRLTTLLKMLSYHQRVVLVADELEGMSTNEEAALRLATFVTTLRHDAERVDIIISVNDDVWSNAFVPRLSGGLQDRLREAEVRLSPLTQEQAQELLKIRQPDASAKLLDALTSAGEPLYSRAVLRSAAGSWVGAISSHEETSATKEIESPHLIIGEDHADQIEEIPAKTPSHDAPVLPDDTMEVSWKASDNDSPEEKALEEKALEEQPVEEIASKEIAPEEKAAEPQAIPATPVFVTAVSEETQDMPPSQEPTVELTEPTVTAEVDAQTAWWDRYKTPSSANAGVFSDTYASSDFNEPESPFASHPAEVETAAATANPFQTQPIAESVFSAQPLESRAEDRVSTLRFAAEAYEIPAERSSAKAEPAWPTNEAPHQPEPPNPTPTHQTPYGAVAEDFTQGLADAAETSQNKEIDRVDELLRQFRERYGRQ